MKAFDMYSMCLFHVLSCRRRRLTSLAVPFQDRDGPRNLESTVSRFKMLKLLSFSRALFGGVSRLFYDCSVHITLGDFSFFPLPCSGSSFYSLRPASRRFKSRRHHDCQGQAGLVLRSDLDLRQRLVSHARRRLLFIPAMCLVAIRP